MADPKLHRRGAPAGWINAREIAAATGFRIQAVLQMLSSKDHMKREPTIWTRVKEYKWKDMPGGGRTKAPVWEEYEAFPGLSWPYRCQTVTDPVFFRYGGSDDFCLRAHIGEDVIRRCRAYREACNLSVPPLPSALHGLNSDEPARLSPRDQRIVEAMRSYTGTRSWRHGWPWLRKLRRHAEMPDITSKERKRLWPLVHEQKDVA